MKRGHQTAGSAVPVVTSTRGSGGAARARRAAGAAARGEAGRAQPVIYSHLPLLKSCSRLMFASRFGGVVHFVLSRDKT